MAARAHLCWCVYSDLRRHCMGCESQNAYLNVCSSTRTHICDNEIQVEFGIDGFGSYVLGGRVAVGEARLARSG